MTTYSPCKVYQGQLVHASGKLHFAAAKCVDFAGCRKWVEESSGQGDLGVFSFQSSVFSFQNGRESRSARVTGSELPTAYCLLPTAYCLLPTA
jgi:hypothetical protein